MTWLNVALVALLISGHSVWATASSSEEVQTVSDHMAHLNYYYPDLDVVPAADVKNPLKRVQMIHELNSLDGFMRGEVAVPAHSLITIACNRPQCDGGDGGKCHVCTGD